MLEKGIGEHCHQGMAVKTMPGSPFEVVEAELFLQFKGNPRGNGVVDPESSHSPAQTGAAREGAAPQTLMVTTDV